MVSSSKRGSVQKHLEHATHVSKEQYSASIPKNGPKCLAKYALNDNRGNKCELAETKGSDSESSIVQTQCAMRRSHPNFTIPQPFRLATDKRASLGGHLRLRNAQVGFPTFSFFKD
mgnify:CR=1 FL=1